MTKQETSLGTRFLLYPQAPFVQGYDKPEIVWVSTPPDAISSGPADSKMYVVEPALPKDPYGFPQLPPFNGPTLPLVKAGPDGHFDHLEPGSPEFLAAHVFGSVRRILDIWENYLGYEIGWHFASDLARLEIIPTLDWDNAHAGYGYLEFGTDLEVPSYAGNYALNFDVIAHEMGHLILLSQIGVPDNHEPGLSFASYHEAVSDLVSLISMLHFDSVLDRLLRRTNGNLLAENELNRLAEQAGERQIRLASNWRRLDETTNEPHDRSAPFTGAVFDTIVEIYHDLISTRNIIELPTEFTASDLRELPPEDFAIIDEAFANAHRFHHMAMKSCLQQARDIVAAALAASWQTLPADEVSFALAGELMLSELTANAHPDHAVIFEENLIWRRILSGNYWRDATPTHPSLISRKF